MHVRPQNCTFHRGSIWVGPHQYCGPDHTLVLYASVLANCQACQDSFLNMSMSGMTQKVMVPSQEHSPNELSNIMPCTSTNENQDEALQLHPSCNLSSPCPKNIPPVPSASSDHYYLLPQQVHARGREGKTVLSPKQPKNWI